MTTTDRNDSGPGKDRDPQDVIEVEPESKRGKAGNAAHGGDQAGPNSDEAGRTKSPQMGSPRQDDRASGD